MCRSAVRVGGVMRVHVLDHSHERIAVGLGQGIEESRSEADGERRLTKGTREVP